MKLTTPTPTDTQRKATSIMGSKKFTLLSGGSRSGKTFWICYAILTRALNCKSRHAILRFHFNDVKRSVGMDTLPNLLEACGCKYDLNKSDWVFYIPCKTGGMSEIWLGGLDDKSRVEKILGNEYSTVYFNEASQISYHAYTTALTRLAENSGLNNKVFIDCNPPEKTHWLYELFILNRQPGTKMEVKNPEQYGYLQMNPADNPHLPAGYISDVLESLPDRQRRRFLYGEWLDKRQGALFDAEHIERARVTAPPQYLPHAVVAIDPAVTSGENSDETGIVTVGRDATGEYYVLSDNSLRGTPAEWSAAVNKAYEEFKLDAAVYESNQGGEMVEHTIHTANPNIPCHSVRATRGKMIRAEPIAALYEQGKVHHVGYFPELEEQMTSWVPEDNYSPDRFDALVHGLVYLMTQPLRTGIQPNNPVVQSDGVGRGYGFASWNNRPIGRPPSFR